MAYVMSEADEHIAVENSSWTLAFLALNADRKICLANVQNPEIAA